MFVLGEARLQCMCTVDGGVAITFKISVSLIFQLAKIPNVRTIAAMCIC